MKRRCDTGPTEVFEHGISSEEGARTPDLKLRTTLEGARPLPERCGLRQARLAARTPPTLPMCARRHLGSRVSQPAHSPPSPRARRHRQARPAARTPPHAHAGECAPAPQRTRPCRHWITRPVPPSLLLLLLLLVVLEDAARHKGLAFLSRRALLAAGHARGDAAAHAARDPRAGGGLGRSAGGGHSCRAAPTAG